MPVWKSWFLAAKTETLACSCSTAHKILYAYSFLFTICQLPKYAIQQFVMFLCLKYPQRWKFHQGGVCCLSILAALHQIESYHCYYRISNFHPVLFQNSCTACWKKKTISKTLGPKFAFTKRVGSFTNRPQRCPPRGISFQKRSRTLSMAEFQILGQFIRNGDWQK